MHTKKFAPWPVMGLWFAATASLTMAAALEDPVARAALPEFKIIPAATPEELSAARSVPIGQFNLWTRSQGDNGSRRYSTLTQINKSNVKDLEMAWVYRSGDGAQNIQCTPIIVDGVMYAPTPGYAMVAVDATNGRELWRLQIDVPARPGLNDLVARRGLVYWPGDADNAPRLIFGSGNWFYAVDPKTGKLLENFGAKGRTAIQGGAKGIGAVYRHVYVVAGGQDHLHGYDVRDGKLLWSFSTVAQGGEFGEPWTTRRSAANNWAGMALDDQRGLAYFTIGDPHPNMIGIDRPGDNLFSNCILALDALTGEYRWHFQGVRHDLWDLDVTGPPNLVTITRDGRQVDAVTAVSKGGLLLMVDRESGKPIFPFRLRRAPVSKLPGETTAPYQPDPELPEQISRVAFDPSEITDRTPEARAAVEKMVARSTYGFYEPFTEGVPNLFRGTRGGGEWGGSAVDVPTGRLYVTSNRWVSRITVIPRDEGDRDPRFPPSAGEVHYTQHCAACHGEVRQGTGVAPPLLSLKTRSNDAAVLEVLKTGRGLMPPNVVLSDPQKQELLDFLFRRNQPPTEPLQPGMERYTFDGFYFLTDHEGYPGIKPPWGELNCYDLSTGKILWRVPLGELEALTKQGYPITGSQNLGGASVTAGGLVFVAGTEDEKLRAFDADTGKELWAAKLPHAGTAAPAIYEVDGRQYVVITATGGGRVGGASGPGDAYVAFALPK
jgi:quinoprotein glucose dehydrogenase